MPKPEDFERINLSLINGNNKQAVEEMQDMGLYYMPELLDYIAEFDSMESAIMAAKIYFRLTQN